MRQYLPALNFYLIVYDHHSYELVFIVIVVSEENQPICYIFPRCVHGFYSVFNNRDANNVPFLNHIPLFVSYAFFTKVFL